MEITQYRSYTNMLRKLSLGIGTVVLTVMLGCSQSLAEETTTSISRPSIGGPKYRILVDKVYVQGRKNALLIDEDYAAVSKMGFNVICPRFHGDNRDLVAHGARLAQKHGLNYMVWLRASLPSDISKRRLHGPKAPALDHEKAPEYKPLKYTLACGHEFDLLSPNSEELWQLLEKSILDVAELSKTLPIIGVFLDFELYAYPRPNYWPGHLYTISYDMKILKEFAAQENLTLPDLKPADRAEWLKARKLLEKFKAFQIQSWRSRLQKLRAKVDAMNPDFQFAVYPSSYTLFVNKAVWQDLSTPKAPILAGEHYTYAKGFPNKDTNKEYWKISDTKGVELNRSFIAQCVRKYSSRGVAYGVLGGIDPVETHGKDPVFQARSVVAMSNAGHGYWVFYEGVKKGTKEFESFELWFTNANKAIEEGKKVLRVK